MKLLATFVASITLACASVYPARAGSHGSAAQVSAAMSEAEVRKVDKDAKKITLKHGEIRNLEMPPMTMVFAVRDAAMLDAVKQGDKVRFRAEKIGGTYTVTSLEAAR